MRRDYRIIHIIVTVLLSTYSKNYQRYSDSNSTEISGVRCKIIYIRASRLFGETFWKTLGHGLRTGEIFLE